jgi:hypothetical protein
LKSSIAEQIQQSELVIAHHFDPRRSTVDRPDRSVKNRDLSALLEFYLDRSGRYGLVAPDAAEEARFFLRTLDQQDCLRDVSLDCAQENSATSGLSSRRLRGQTG